MEGKVLGFTNKELTVLLSALEVYKFQLVENGQRKSKRAKIAKELFLRADKIKDKNQEAICETIGHDILVETESLTRGDPCCCPSCGKKNKIR